MNTSSELYSSSTSKPMGEAVGNNSRRSNTSREMESLSLEIRKYPRNLLQLATNQSSSSSSPTSRRRGEPRIGLGRDDGDGDGDDDEDDDSGGGINLGLGLSLGGKFGVDKSHKVLKRSSSVIGTIPFIMEDEMASVHTALARTTSLPLETEDEWRKRKEIQTLRRMEAKRRRSEKQKSLKGSEEKGFENDKFGGVAGNNPFGSSSSSSSTIAEMKGRRTTFGSLQGFLTAQDQRRCPQESEGGGGSSTASELDSRAHQGSGNWGESISPPSIQSSSLQRGSNEATGSFPCKVEKTERCCGPQVERSLKKREADMPSVFTIGDGRKVEGILYKYGKGEEVRIMCVCHGSFFSPAEFVKHAGGTNVDHPLRHIVVSPSPSALR